MLAAAMKAFSQGVAYYHAGMDLLRTNRLDRNSFDSGDWFNRIDWSGQGQLLRYAGCRPSRTTPRAGR